MYYYCTKLNAFKLPELAETTPAGGIIAASAVPFPMLIRRKLMPYPQLRHRLFDPQLYLATLDPRTASGTVYKLATYSWFGAQPVAYDSTQHGTLNDYKNQFQADLHGRWPGRVPTDDQAILDCVREALLVQISLGCEGLIIPSPLTNARTNYQLETKYMDAAIQLLPDLPATPPMFATIAISDGILRNTDPATNTLIQTITDNVAARTELAGAYVVLEQTAETGYVCINEETLFALLIICDDIARGAGKQVIVNYLGPFGAVTLAAGATIWSSGYYRSQRRMKLADQEEDVGRSYPRFYSSPLAGDLGVAEDLELLNRAGLLHTVFSRSQASSPLLHAIENGTYPQTAPQWEYRPGNIWAAAAHYNDICCKIDAYFDSRNTEQKINDAERWLTQAVAHARQAGQAGIAGNHSDLRHQAIWLTAFARWRRHAGV